MQHPHAVNPSLPRGRAPRRLFLPVVAALIALSGATHAQLASGGGASILIFPLVVADGARDTLIEVGNATTQLAFARCRYVGAAGAAPTEWFDLVLNAKQPTHWGASRGRSTDPTDVVCGRNLDDELVLDCDGAGLDPGRIPPLTPPFAGAVVCVQLDRSGAPVSGNALRGAASLIDVADSDVSRYAAVGLPGLSSNDGDGVLCLGGEPRPGCPSGAEYGACPEVWRLAHLAEGAPDPVAPDAATVHTDLALAACSIGAPSTVQLLVTTELEQRFSASFPIHGWRRVGLDEVSAVLQFADIGSQHLLTYLKPAGGQPGVMVVAESRRVANATAPAGGAGAVVPQFTGASLVADVIEIPED